MKEESKSLSVFERLSAINVNDKVEKKSGLTYLSWAWAWSEVKKAYPDANYQVGETVQDDLLGYMCNTSVTIQGETLVMWLPVMDGANKAMKSKAYTYSTRFGDKSVEAATMFDINKTLMRCLVKNLAMFGFGIYIYAGEDLPEVEAAAESVAASKPASKLLLEVDDANWARVLAYATENKTLGLDGIVKALSVKYDISIKAMSALKKSLK
jgi:hypothetical protein